MTRVLVLAGTTEATRLAERLVDEGVEVISSLAGVTSHPVPRPGRTRTGGFGGVAGLRAYLVAERIDALVDATHPFAAQMPHHAARAAAEAGVPVVRLLRPAWTPTAGDRWIVVPDLHAAREALPRLEVRRALLTVGRRGIEPFLDCRGISFVIRAIDAPDEVPPDATVVLERGPFDLSAERQLLQEHRVEAVVAKNAGGMATRAKLDAARELGLPVVMVERPPQPPIPQVDDVEGALRWLAELTGDGVAGRNTESAGSHRRAGRC